MKKTLAILLAILVSDFSRAQDKVFYISSTTGSDSNPGTLEAPLRSIGALVAERKNGATILLRTGDIFFETLSGCSDCTISSYGEGRKPIICGFRIQKDASSWVEEGRDIWRLDMSRDDDFYGFRYGSVSNQQYYGNVGGLWCPDNNRIIGNLVFKKDLLKKEGDFIVTDKWKKVDITDDDLRYLYIKSSFRPRAYCLVSGSNGVYDMTRCSISGIAVIGFGGHGISACRECTISDCDIDIIGGSLLIGRLNYPVRYGNGIEFWIGDKPCKGNTVRGCQISRCYDTAATIQGPSTREVHSAGNHFTGNRIAYCRQGFEHWATTDGDSAVFEDCCFNDNILFCCGDNKFEGTPSRDNDVALLAYKAPAEFFEIKGNLIYGKHYRFNEGCTPGLGGGEVYIVSGSNLLYDNGRFRTVIKARSATHLDFYRAWCGDDSKITIVQPGSPEDLAAQSKVSRALKFKYPTPSADELLRYNK